MDKQRKRKNKLGHFSKQILIHFHIFCPLIPLISEGFLCARHCSRWWEYIRDYNRRKQETEKREGKPVTTKKLHSTTEEEVISNLKLMKMEQDPLPTPIFLHFGDLGVPSICIKKRLLNKILSKVFDTSDGLQI